MPIGETNAVLGQLVDMGRTNIFGSLKAQVGPSEIIGQKDNDIGFVLGLQSRSKAPGKEKEEQVFHCGFFSGNSKASVRKGSTGSPFLEKRLGKHSLRQQ